MLFATAAATVLTVANVFGGTVWDGGGGDSNIDTPANWDADTAPAFDGSATVTFGTGGSTATVNTAVGFLGLVFNRDGAFTLANGAGTLTLGSGGVSAQIPNTTARTYTIAKDVTLAANQVWFVTNNTGVTLLTVSGAITDGASTFGITKTGSGTLELGGNNSYDGPTVVKSGGKIQITHSNALGSTAGGTTVEDGGRLDINGVLSTAEPITLSGQGPGNSGVFFNTGTNTMSGLLTIAGGADRLNNSGGASILTVSGGITSSVSPFFILNTGGGTIRVTDKPLMIGGGTLWSDQPGTLALGASSNVWGGTTFDQVTVRTDATNAFPAGAQIPLTRTAKIDLNGFDQTVNRIYSSTLTETNSTVTSAMPATLTLNQSANTLYCGRFSGALTVVKFGANSLTLSNASSNVGMVISNGTLELATQTCLADNGALTIADGGGAKLKIGTGLMEAVGRLFFGGVQQVSGIWGATGSGAAHIDDVHFTGGGTVYVATSPGITVTDATWDAEGGAGDTKISTATNWVGDALPSLAGTTRALFGTAGSVATLNTNASLYGVVFNRAADFTLTNDTGTLTLGLGGISAVIPDVTSRTYTVTAPVILTENQSWGVTNNGAGVATLVVSGNIDDGLSPYGITKSGSGPLVLSGSNSYDGVTLVKTGGIVRITNACALGTTNGMTRIEEGAWLEVSGNVTVAEPIEINGDAASFYAGALRATGGSNIWSGPVTSATGTRIGNNGGTYIEFTGGLTALSGFAMQHYGTVKFSVKPFALSGIYAHGSGLLILNVASNIITSGFFDIRSGTVRTDVTGALPTNTTINISPNGMLDLNGYSQVIGQLQSGEPTNTTVHTLTSAAPAILTVNQSANTFYSGRITGSVGLTKTGGGTLTLTNSLNTASGAVTVSNGMLTVSATSSLGNSTNIVVAGGMLSLLTQTGITNSASLRVANGGGAKVSVASGLAEEVLYLYFGTLQQRVGTYGATGSGAQVIDNEHFSGLGVIKVLRDNKGMVFRIQ